MGIKRMCLELVPSLLLDLTMVTELYHVIADEAPDAVKAGEIKNHFGRKVAIVSEVPYCLNRSSTHIFQDAYRASSDPSNRPSN